jgi:protein gp37
LGKTKIEWTEYSWNPVSGCTPISEGCQNCYAKRMANRLRGRCGYPADEPFKVTLHKDRLEEPLRLKKPRRVFVCSMGDLFHEDVPGWMSFEVMDIILQAKQHTFLILTKRPANKDGTQTMFNKIINQYITALFSFIGQIPCFCGNNFFEFILCPLKT